MQRPTNAGVPTATDAAQQRPVFSLEAIGGEKDGLHFEIGEEGLLIGRSATCDVIFDNREVSRRHAYFYTHEGRAYVEDLGSKNGVWVNGTQRKKQRLTDGDTVDTGPMRFVLRVSQEVAPAGWMPPREQRDAPRAPRRGDVGEGGAPPFRSTLAVGSMAFAVLSYLHWAFGVGAIVLALLAMVEIRRGGDEAGRALAVAGLVMGVVGAGMHGWFAEAAPRLRERAATEARAACQANLVRISTAVSEYRREHGGELPGGLAELVEEGLLEPSETRCPGSALLGGVPHAYLTPGLPARGGSDVLACDGAAAWHLGQGGWALHTDGTIEWFPEDQFRLLLVELKALPGTVPGGDRDPTER